MWKFTMPITLAIIIAIQESGEECGHQATFNKILDGELTAIDEFPWMALLEYKNAEGISVGFGCSGILVTERHVLTTAHCIKDLEERDLQLFSVRLGEYNTSSETDCVEMMGFKDCADFPQNIKTERWVAHPEHYKHVDDIAVIKLSKSAKITDFVRTICLPFSNNVGNVGQVLVAAGWGRTENGSNSSVKLKVSVPVVPFNDCFEKYRRTKTILNGSQHLCAGSVEGKDTCIGDSGGPLMATWGEDARWIVIGIISTGNGCGLEGWPAVYMRVDYYREWILDQIKLL